MGGMTAKVFPGPLSRRALLGRAGAVIGVVAAAAPAGADQKPPATSKIAQSVAKYQDHPKGPQRCEICLQFKPPNECQIVQGPISPTGWCQFFAAKENAH